MLRICKNCQRKFEVKVRKRIRYCSPECYIEGWKNDIKKWREKRKKEWKKYSKTYMKDYRKKNRKILTEKNKKWRKANKTKFNEWSRINRQKNRHRINEWKKINREERRLHALQKICGKEVPECKYCRCDDIRILQVNHKNGTTKERKINGKMILDNINTILSGKQKIDDLEVTCILCNWNYFIKKRFGIDNLKVVWNPIRK